MLVLIFCVFVKGWKWGCLISHLYWTGRIREFLGTLNCSFWWRLRNNNFLASKELSSWQLSRSGSIFSPRLESCKAFFYVVPPWHQEPVCSQAHVYGWPKLQIEKGYQVPIVDSLECVAQSLQLELAWFKMTTQRNQKREFHTFARDGDKSKYVQRWF